MTEQNSLYDRVFNTLVKRRDRIISGKINCISWNLPRFEEENPGIEQGNYYLLSANSKIGKLLPS